MARISILLLLAAFCCSLAFANAANGARSAKVKRQQMLCAFDAKYCDGLAISHDEAQQIVLQNKETEQAQADRNSEVQQEVDPTEVDGKDSQGDDEEDEEDTNLAEGSNETDEARARRRRNRRNRRRGGNSRFNRRARRGRRGRRGSRLARRGRRGNRRHIRRIAG